MEKLNELVEALYPKYGAPGSRDVDVTARRKAIDESAAAISAAFRALEQRAEAAEAKIETALRAVDNLDAERNVLRAKLAELAKQEPIGRVERGEANDNNEYPDVRVVCLHDQADWINFQDGTELFLRPAPAADLAELVPCEGFLEETSDESMLTWQRGWNSCRAAILRKIEEAK